MNLSKRFAKKEMACCTKLSMRAITPFIMAPSVLSVKLKPKKSATVALAGCGKIKTASKIIAKTRKVLSPRFLFKFTTTFAILSCTERYIWLRRRFGRLDAQAGPASRFHPSGRNFGIRSECNCFGMSFVLLASFDLSGCQN